MYTEIVKIIEGGLNSDSKKVLSYAKHLAYKLEESGDGKLAKKIIDVIEGRKGALVYQDKLLHSPVDSETRLNIANIILPEEIDIDIRISNSIKFSVDEFISIVSSKSKLQKFGLEINSSLLLYGPPGSGKTSLAKYIAKDLGLPLIVARFDSLISSLLGNTSKNVRKLFDYANERPCILFLDEFDAIAKARNDSQELGELKRVINSLLQNIDEFTQNNILIAATNHEELLDKAVWRRFEKVIEIGKPSLEEIVDLLKFFMKDVPNDFIHDERKNITIAHQLYSLTHSEIKKIIHKAISKFVINNKDLVGFEDLLLEIFLYNNHNVLEIEKASRYLNDHGVSQNVIKDIFNISLRQVRNLLNL